MESFQGNIEMIRNDNSKYIFTDGENIYELTIDKREEAVEFVLAIEGGIQKYKTIFNQTELLKFSLFKVVDSLDNVLQIIDVCLKKKEVKLTYQKSYVMTFFSLYFKTTYLTATIVFAAEEIKVEYTVSRLGDMVISLYKDNKIKAEEINTLKKLIADTKDQVKNLTDLINEKSLFDQDMILELKNDIQKETSKTNNRLIALEDQTYCVSGSKILKKEDYELLKSWLGSKFELKLLYSSYNDGDLATTFHSKCDGVGPTLTLIESNFGKKFGGYITSKWNSSGNWIKGDGTEFLFSLDKKSKYANKQTAHAIYGNPGYHVTFGAGHDIHLSDKCTTTSNSYSGPNGFEIPANLAGSYNFQVNIVEVFKVF
jgi:hypothetical protein